MARYISVIKEDKQNLLSVMAKFSGMAIVNRDAIKKELDRMGIGHWFHDNKNTVPNNHHCEQIG